MYKYLYIYRFSYGNNGVGWGYFLTGRRRLKLCRGGCENFRDDQILVSNFRFTPQIFWGVILPPKWQLRASCGGHSCHRSVQALALMGHVPSMGSCSQFCLILHPHCVAVTFCPNFASPWRNSFVQIHYGEIWDHSSKMTPKRPKFGGGVIIWYKHTPLWEPPFKEAFVSVRIYIYIIIHV